MNKNKAWGVLILALSARATILADEKNVTLRDNHGHEVMQGTLTTTDQQSSIQDTIAAAQAAQHAQDVSNQWINFSMATAVNLSLKEAEVAYREKNLEIQRRAYEFGEGLNRVIESTPPNEFWKADNRVAVQTLFMVKEQEDPQAVHHFLLNLPPETAGRLLYWADLDLKMNGTSPALLRRNKIISDLPHGNSDGKGVKK